MARIIVKETKEERGEISGNVNTLQARDRIVVYSARKLVIRRKIAGPLKSGRRKIHTIRQEIKET